ncbi:hypothetical protein [Saccharopolyspora sp. ASAGF58]|uniref:hypothetical protein n=1 Tax=Saccharopolyspora sp. ASAGF58 TaxID=2719023 RepID=UPI00143FC967|nr:hypothetical protein [Saccharopolyspora sp. ASAGF58]QIZ38027.1 hypothetical protein FDZ84_29975 [Saccharopolyspora sp. ASAGF58]
MTGELVTRGADLWKQLVERGDLREEDQDRELVTELVQRLRLPTDIPIREALVDVSTERLVREFFAVAEPFAAMWADLLALFERATAITGADQLDISFDFSGEDPKLTFDLQHFRRTVEIVRELMSPFDLHRTDQAGLWNMVRAFGPNRPENNRSSRWPQVTAEVLREGPFPEELPERPSSDEPRLDALLEETWQLTATVLHDARTVFGRRAAIYGDRDPLPAVPSGFPGNDLRVVISDYWFSSLLQAMARAMDANVGPELADVLEEALAPLRNADPGRRSAQRRLEELLSLPLWKHRYDLYSNWVTTRLVAALEDAGPVIHSARGRIEFLFSGTHLATFDKLRPRAHLWCEYRTPLADPVGKRKGNIQPDIALRQDPITADLVPLVVECKQYAKSDSRSFAAALTDYAHGHPAARVVLVNYGPGREKTIVDKVAGDVQDRTAFIPFFRPGSPAALDLFCREVRTAVGLPTLRDDLAETERDGAGTVTLTWSSAPSDLDLHLLIGNPPRWTVDYRDFGSLDAEPFAQLEGDIRSPGGGEVVRIGKWLATEYLVEVVNYSREGVLANAVPTVEVTVDGRLHRFTCPQDVPLDRWRVCRIDGRTGEVTGP